MKYLIKSFIDNSSLFCNATMEDRKLLFEFNSYFFVRLSNLTTSLLLLTINFLVNRML